MSIIVITSRNSVYSAALEPVPAYPFYAQVKRDYELTSDGRPRTQGRYKGITTPSVDFAEMKDAMPGVNVGMPDQYAYQPNSFLSMTEERQWWLININCLSAYGKRYDQLTKAAKTEARLQWASFVSTKTCFTNRASYEDGKTDYIQKKNLLVKDPIGWEQILCSHNLVKVLGKPEIRFVSYLSTRPQRYLHYPIECVDLNKPLPAPEEILSKPWLCHTPEISTGQPLPDGVYGHEPFPQFGERSRYVLMAKGGVGYYRADWLTRIKV